MKEFMKGIFCWLKIVKDFVFGVWLRKKNQDGNICLYQTRNGRIIHYCMVGEIFLPPYLMPLSSES
jgi:hypothetical protein